MTLQQAFTEWAAIPQNTVLAAKSRSAVNAVLMKTHGGADVRQFTAYYARQMFKECNEPASFKVKAASILVHVLEYAASREKCVKPEFDFTIASADKESSISGEATAQCAEEPPSRDGHGRFAKGRAPENKGRKWDEYMSPEGQENSKRGWKNLIEHRPEHRSDDAGRPKMAVSQLDPDTLAVMASFESVSEASRATGIKNIRRSLQNGLMAGGYYWVRAGYETDFKPGYTRSPRTQDTHPKSVMQVDPEDGRVVAEFDSIADAARAMGSTRQNISAALRRKQKAMGFYWFYEGTTAEQISSFVTESKEYKKDTKNRGGRKEVAVSQLDPETLEVTASFDSMKQAARALGIKSDANIIYAVRHCSMTHGYYFCPAGMEKDFAPNPNSKHKGTAMKDKSKNISDNLGAVASRERGDEKPQIRSGTTASPLSSFSDQELSEELKRRGWRGSIYMRLDL